MMKQKHKGKASLCQLIVAAFVISVIPLYVFFLTFINMSFKSNRETIFQTIRYECESAMQGIERSIQSIQTRQFELLEDDTVTRLAFPKYSTGSAYERVSDIKKVQSALRLVVSLNDIIDTISIYYPEKGFVLSQNADSGYKAIENLETLHWLNDVYKNAKGMLATREDIFLVTASTARGAAKLEPSMMLPQVVIITKVSVKTLEQELQIHAGTEQGKDFLLLSGRSVITSTLESEKQADFVCAIVEKEGIESATPLKVGKELYTVFGAGSSLSEWKLYEAVNESVAFRRINDLKIFIPLITVFVFIVINTFIFLVYGRLYRPMKRLTESFLRVKQGDFEVALKGARTSDIESVYQSFNEMTGELKRHIETEYTQQLLLKDAELKQLQFQISPHFLYNSFFILQSFLEEEEYESAEHMTNVLGTYLRYITRNRQPFSTLEEEDRHARAYMEIQQIRFMRTLKTNFSELPSEIADVRVPRLILQPLIENAFAYGIAKEQIGVIEVKYRVSSSRIEVLVEDSGSGNQFEHLEKIQAILAQKDTGYVGIALNNIHSRLRGVYGEGSGLRAEASPLGGVRMIILIDRGEADDSCFNRGR